MKVAIPATIDLAKLLKDQGLSKTRMKSMRDKIHYFLSLLTRTNDNAKFLLDDANYKKLCSTILKNLLGNADYYEVRKILESSDDPILEKNNKWKNSNTKKNTKDKNSNDDEGYCQGYRIIAKHDTGNIKYVRINKTLSDRIIESSRSDISKSYSFLTNQFKMHKVTLDQRAYVYLAKYYKELKLLTGDNQYQIKVLKNHIGRWLYYISKINKNDLWYSVSNENHRLSSTFTSIPKELSMFILINDKPLEMIDIKSSQPYILSTIIKTRFFLENKVGYNLKTIHLNAYKKILSIINTSRYLFTNNPVIPSTSPYKQSITRSSLYMWCEFLSENEAQSLTEYALYPFKMDFYMDIIDKSLTNFDDQSNENKRVLREKLKGVMMFILFDDNFMNRNNNLYMKLFKKIYPGVNAWIEKMHGMIGKKEFSYILQRTESYLLLNNVCREFHLKHNMAPIFTIHDGLYTTKEYIDELTSIANTILTNLIGSTPGIKHTYETITTDPETDVIMERWKKIKVVDSKKMFSKIEHTILDNNIKMAEEFLKNYSYLM